MSHDFRTQIILISNYTIEFKHQNRSLFMKCNFTILVTQQGPLSNILFIRMTISFSKNSHTRLYLYLSLSPNSFSPYTHRHTIYTPIYMQCHTHTHTLSLLLFFLLSHLREMAVEMNSSNFWTFPWSVKQSILDPSIQVGHVEVLKIHSYSLKHVFEL